MSFATVVFLFKYYKRNNFKPEYSHILLKYNNLLFSARKAQQFGNEYHLLALATFLKTKIFIYQTFKSNNTFYFCECNSYELNIKFNEPRINLGRHLKYIPLEDYEQTTFISGFLDTEKIHYSAIIPKNVFNYDFEPRSNIFCN